ncbi:Tryptophan synthase beta type 2 [Hibiscus syriacus]|uniref:Tryptophan synthase beta type 2 n=2 Tax=Hibiscus syriacus TaxID=106335 RepID=A0A6A2YYL4_HIBSY|nr:Tryptophan synthase beta type 2 [Hibiscus syriacus]
MVMMGIGRMVVSLKSKLRSLKTMKKDYDKVEKSESMRVEIRSRKARKLIERTLKIADSPTSKTFAF